MRSRAQRAGIKKLTASRSGIRDQGIKGIKGIKEHRERSRNQRSGIRDQGINGINGIKSIGRDTKSRSFDSFDSLTLSFL
jgi:hypothetical protein